MGKKATLPAIFVMLSIYFLCMQACSTRPAKKEITPNEDITHNNVVNFFVENSGSMKGYFNGNTQIKDIIKEYYDRISEYQNEGDTIKLNFINTEIENYPNEIKEYLLKSQSKCTATYTKIDDILSMAMEGLNDSTVNIVISDFCFTSNDGSFSMAQSDITKSFSKRIKDDADLSVAIVKYMSDFDGVYFPGGIRCKKPLPFYLWIFGNEKQVKRIVNIPIKAQNCGTFILQPFQSIMSNIITKKARMVEDNSIVVKEWDKDRQRSGGLFSSCSSDRTSSTYSLNIDMDMSRVILPKEDICNIAKYQITVGYSIESINNKKGDIYSFKISTGKPAPGKLSIAYLQQEMPEWVFKSNFIGKGIPTDSATLGVKYLIEGVYDAYNNISDKVFETKIILK